MISNPSLKEPDSISFPSDSFSIKFKTRLNHEMCKKVKNTDTWSPTRKNSLTWNRKQLVIFVISNNSRILFISVEFSRAAKMLCKVFRKLNTEIPIHHVINNIEYCNWRRPSIYQNEKVANFIFATSDCHVYSSKLRWKVKWQL